MNEIFCFRCGSCNIDSAYSNTHDRCRDCGFTTRFEPTDCERRPQVEQRAPGVVRATRRNGGTLVEQEHFTGKELSSRPIKRKDVQARPTPVVTAAGGRRVG